MRLFSRISEFSDESSNYLTSTNLQSNATIGFTTQPRTQTELSIAAEQLVMEPVKTVQDIERVILFVFSNTLTHLNVLSLNMIYLK